MRGCFPFWECEFQNYLLKIERKANFVGIFSAKKMFAIKLNFNPNILSVRAKTFDGIFFNIQAIQRNSKKIFISNIMNCEHDSFAYGFNIAEQPKNNFT